MELFGSWRTGDWETTRFLPGVGKLHIAFGLKVRDLDFFPVEKLRELSMESIFSVRDRVDSGEDFPRFAMIGSQYDFPDIDAFF